MGRAIVVEIQVFEALFCEEIWVLEILECVVCVMGDYLYYFSGVYLLRMAIYP